MRPAILVAVLLASGGCIRAPNIVVVDRATALEREAAGSFPDLELELERTGTAARPVPLTRAQLEAAGVPRPMVADEEASEAERTDALLRARCVGEALDGTLVETRDTCAAKDVPHLGSLLERTNRDRAQIWQWLKGKRPERSFEEVRRAWREVHLRGLVCGGQLQRSDGAWEVKTC